MCFSFTSRANCLSRVRNASHDPLVPVYGDVLESALATFRLSMIT